MGDMKLGAIETRFAEIIWTNAPLTTNQLIKLCAEELEWKRTTTCLNPQIIIPKAEIWFVMLTWRHTKI